MLAGSKAGPVPVSSWAKGSALVCTGSLVCHTQWQEGGCDILHFSLNI